MFNFKPVWAPLALALVPVFCIPRAAQGDEAENATPVVDEVVVIAQRLNEARNGIQTKRAPQPIRSTKRPSAPSQGATTSC
jgi:hypothetical protein